MFLVARTRDCARGRLRNAPGQDKVRFELISRLVTHCGQNLSEDEVLRETALVDTLARTPEGHVDPLALLASNVITDSRVDLIAWPSHCGMGKFYGPETLIAAGSRTN